MSRNTMVLQDLQTEVLDLNILFLRSMDETIQGHWRDLKDTELARDIDQFEKEIAELMAPTEFRELEKEIRGLNREDLAELRVSYLNQLRSLDINASHITSREKRNVSDFIGEVEDSRIRDMLRVVWKHGDKMAREGVVGYLDGNSDILFDLDPKEARGKTTQENGRKVYHLSQDFSSLVDNTHLMDSSLVLSHEFHRDGLNLKNPQETRETVKSDMRMVQSMQNSYQRGLYSRNIQFMQFLNYIEKSYGSQKLNIVIDKVFDSTLDYWKVKMYAGSTHEVIDDGSKLLSIAYYNKDDEIISSIKNLNNGQSKLGYAASLTSVMGLERSESILGGDLNNLSIYGNQTLIDVLKLSKDQVQSVRHDPGVSLESFKINDKEKMSLVGEALLIKAGGSWNDKAGKWTSLENLSYLLTDQTVEGNIMAEPVKGGGFNYSTINANVYRDTRSYKGWSKHEGSLFSKENQGLDYIMLTKKNIEGNVIARLVFDGFHTVDNMTKNVDGDNLNQPYTHPKYGKIQGNTVAEGDFNMTYYGTSNFSNTVGDVNNAVLIINNAKTIAGDIIDNRGKDGNSNDRWLQHSLRGINSSDDWTSYYSDGCFVAPWTTTQSFLDTLNVWGASKGYQIKTDLQEFEYHNHWEGFKGN